MTRTADCFVVSWTLGLHRKHLLLFIYFIYYYYSRTPNPSPKTIGFGVPETIDFLREKNEITRAAERNAILVASVPLGVAISLYKWNINAKLVLVMPSDKSEPSVPSKTHSAANILKESDVKEAVADVLGQSLPQSKNSVDQQKDDEAKQIEFWSQNGKKRLSAPIVSFTANKTTYDSQAMGSRRPSIQPCDGPPILKNKGEDFVDEGLLDRLAKDLLNELQPHPQAVPQSKSIETQNTSVTDAEDMDSAPLDTDNTFKTAESQYKEIVKGTAILSSPEEPNTNTNVNAEPGSGPGPGPGKSKVDNVAAAPNFKSDNLHPHHHQPKLESEVVFSIADTGISRPRLGTGTGAPEDAKSNNDSVKSVGKRKQSTKSRRQSVKNLVPPFLTDDDGQNAPPYSMTSKIHKLRRIASLFLQAGESGQNLLDSRREIPVPLPALDDPRIRTIDWARTLLDLEMEELQNTDQAYFMMCRKYGPEVVLPQIYRDQTKFKDICTRQEIQIYKKFRKCKKLPIQSSPSVPNLKNRLAYQLLFINRNNNKTNQQQLEQQPQPAVSQDTAKLQKSEKDIHCEPVKGTILVAQTRKQNEVIITPTSAVTLDKNANIKSPKLSTIIPTSATTSSKSTSLLPTKKVDIEVDTEPVVQTNPSSTIQNYTSITSSSTVNGYSDSSTEKELCQTILNPNYAFGPKGIYCEKRGQRQRQDSKNSNVYPITPDLSFAEVISLEQGTFFDGTFKRNFLDSNTPSRMSLADESDSMRSRAQSQRQVQNVDDEWFLEEEEEEDEDVDDDVFLHRDSDNDSADSDGIPIKSRRSGGRGTKTSSSGHTSLKRITRADQIDTQGHVLKARPIFQEDDIVEDQSQSQSQGLQGQAEGEGEGGDAELLEFSVEEGDETETDNDNPITQNFYKGELFGEDIDNSENENEYSMIPATNTSPPPPSREQNQSRAQSAGLNEIQVTNLNPLSKSSQSQSQGQSRSRSREFDSESDSDSLLLRDDDDETHEPMSAEILAAQLSVRKSQRKHKEKTDACIIRTRERYIRFHQKNPGFFSMVIDSMDMEDCLQRLSKIVNGILDQCKPIVIPGKTVPLIGKHKQCKVRATSYAHNNTIDAPMFIRQRITEFENIGRDFSKGVDPLVSIQKQQLKTKQFFQNGGCCNTNTSNVNGNSLIGDSNKSSNNYCCNSNNSLERGAGDFISGGCCKDMGGNRQKKPCVPIYFQPSKCPPDLLSPFFNRRERNAKIQKIIRN